MPTDLQIKVGRRLLALEAAGTLKVWERRNRGIPAGYTGSTSRRSLEHYRRMIAGIDAPGQEG